MTRIMKLTFFFFIVTVFFSLNSLDAKDINKIFNKKDTIKIQTSSGDCMVKTTKDDKITLKISHTYPEGCFQPEFHEFDTSLILEENISGPCSGRSIWQLMVPEKTAIKFRSASGDFKAYGLKSEISSSTASGDIELGFINGEIELRSASGDFVIENSTGDVSISSASGDIELDDITGSLDIKTASGDIEAKKIEGKEISFKSASGDISLSHAKGEFKIKVASGDIEIEDAEIIEESYFKSASGDIYVGLAKSSDYDITLSSASGNSVLDYNGQAIRGYFEFTAREDEGRIVSPLKYDNEESFFRHGYEYMKKSFTRKSKTPRIIIKTSSGKAELKK